jgi:hypothetical protein
MKRALSVALFLISLATVALADGPGIPPTGATTHAKIGILKLADGPGIPPTGAAADAKIGIVKLADGPGIPPAR